MLVITRLRIALGQKRLPETHYQARSIQQMQCEGRDRTYWEDHLTRILNAVRQQGVVHGDVREANVLWDSEAKRLYGMIALDWLGVVQ